MTSWLGGSLKLALNGVAQINPWWRAQVSEPTGRESKRGEICPSNNGDHLNNRLPMVGSSGSEVCFASERIRINCDCRMAKCFQRHSWKAGRRNYEITSSNKLSTHLRPKNLFDQGDVHRIEIDVPVPQAAFIFPPVIPYVVYNVASLIMSGIKVCFRGWFKQRRIRDSNRAYLR